MMNAAASARLLQESLAVAEAGRRAEAEQRWDVALAQFERCVALFLQLIQGGALTPEQRTQLRATCAEYLDRAEACKRLLAAPAAVAVAGDVGAWAGVWRRVFLPEEGDELLQSTWCKLEMPGQPVRRGRLFVSRRRLCFAPHAQEGKHAAAEAASFAAPEAVKLPVSAVVGCSREAAYLGLSSRLAVATAAGTLLFRGLGERRDAVAEALQWACEQQRARSRVFGAAPGLAVPRAVAAALEERLAEDWTADAGDELLVRGAAAALDSGRHVWFRFSIRFSFCSLIVVFSLRSEPDWSTLGPATLLQLLLRYLRESVPPVLPLELLSSLLDPSRPARLAVVARLPEPSRLLLRFLSFFFAAVEAACEYTRMDGAALAALFAPALCRVAAAGDGVAVAAVADFLLLLMHERRTAF